MHDRFFLFFWIETVFSVPFYLRKGTNGCCLKCKTRPESSSKVISTIFLSNFWFYQVWNFILFKQKIILIFLVLVQLLKSLKFTQIQKGRWRFDEKKMTSLFFRKFATFELQLSKLKFSVFSRPQLCLYLHENWNKTFIVFFQIVKWKRENQSFKTKASKK